MIITGLLIPAAALAELKTGVVAVSPMLGGILMEGEQPVDDDGFAYSLGLGYNLSKEFGLEAVLPELFLQRFEKGIKWGGDTLKVGALAR